MDAPTPTPMVIGTSTPAPPPALSVAASCYPSPPIDNSIGIEESIDVESDSDELETDTQGIRCASRGGRPPLPKNKRKRNVRKKSIVWQHFTRDLESHVIIIVGMSINVTERAMAPLTCCTMSKHANSTKHY